MGRNPCCSKEGLNRGAWTAREDKILRDYITVHGEGRWRDLPKKAGLKRCGKSCRLRWLNYLRPDIKRGNISPDEEELIIRLHKLLGNRWSLIAGRLPGRTDNEIKNYWNTNLVKRVQDQSTISASTPPKSSKQSQPPLKMGSHVIKTKAIKCSKVFINPDSDKNIQQFCNNPYDTAAAAADNNQPFESDRYNKNPSDLLMDLNLGADFTFSDLLNSDFSSPSDHLPLVFTDEMLQDNFWMAAIDSTTENATSYLNSFDSFL